MAAVSFAAQTQDSNEQLIDRLTANLAWLLKPLAQAPQQLPYQKQQNHGPSVCYRCGLTEHFSRDCNNLPLSPPDPLVEATSENASQPEKNPFFAFNLTDNNHNMDELAINTFESTRKKKKAKVDFILDPNKASTSTADNNEPPKTKVFKNPPKLKFPKIVQKFGPYSVVKDLIKTPAHITFGQLMTHLQFRKNLYKSLIPKKKTPKTNKHSSQVAGYFIDLILDSGLSVSVIAKHFLKAIGRKIDEPSTRPITNIHGDKKKDLGIAKAISVHINGISIETDIKVSEAKEYTIIVGNKWLKKAKALLDYELCKLIIRYGEKSIVVKYHYWTTPPATKQNQEDEQSEESDNEESDKKDE
ncbi:hypothetical protein G9A89_007487 [Geosiphon pyriformis]|nr:hypothetical protein G9A89_007487 [Geosiphon pyriformis]